MTDLRTQIRSSTDCDASRDAVQLYYVYCTNTDGLVPGSWSRHPLLRHASRDMSCCSSLLFYKAGTMISNNVYTFLDTFTISQLYTPMLQQWLAIMCILSLDTFTSSQLWTCAGIDRHVHLMGLHTFTNVQSCTFRVFGMLLSCMADKNL